MSLFVSFVVVVLYHSQGAIESPSASIEDGSTKTTAGTPPGCLSP